jgi:choline dehydrogenase
MVERVTPLIDRLVARGVLEAPKDPWWQRSDRAEVLRKSDQCEFHPCGTCGIGRVVDERLRVKGLDCLRVADASVIPIIPQANPNLACMMIGLRAGQMLSSELS